MKGLFYRRRRVIVALFHALMIAFALELAFLFRFDLSIPHAERDLLRLGLLIALPLKLTVFQAMRLHRGWWRFAGVPDLVRVAIANVTASAAFGVAAYLAMSPRFPRSVYFIDFMLCFLFTAGGRFAIRLQNELFAKELSTRESKGVLIYGAGAAGRMLLHEIRSKGRLGWKVLGFLDDDVRKRHIDLSGVPVLGTGRDAARAVERFARRSCKVEEIIVAMPSASGRQMQEALANCRAAGVPCRTLPGIRDLVSNKVLSAQIRNVAVDDLLGREQVRLDEAQIAKRIAGRRILITGAAGSIGAELCRQAARFGPARLIALDQAESELYRLELEMAKRFPTCEFVPEIGDICDAERVREILVRHRVEAIYHAAAYKHVPMMELHVVEALKNNVIGAWNLVRTARRCGVADFVMISSDKAVNPGEHHGRDQTGSGVDRIGDLGRYATGDECVVGSFWKCPCEQWQRRAALPGPDRSGWSGDGDSPGGQPLLHESPGSGATGSAGFGNGLRRRDFRFGHGRGDSSGRSCRKPDPDEWPFPGRRYRNSLYRASARRAPA